MLTPASVAAEYRRQRYARRQVSSAWLIAEARTAAGLDPVAPAGTTASSPEWVRPPRPARCRWRIGETVSVHADDTGAHYGGLERCASVWACPVCSAVIRADRARDIETAVSTWLGTPDAPTGRGLAFVTLTLRHRRSDPLAVTLDAALRSWQDMLRGRAWLDLRKAYGIAGYVRAVEVTWGEDHGWHPHVHALLLLDAPLTPTQEDALTSTLYGRWSRGVVKHGARLPTRLRGIDMRQADQHGRVLAQYLAKVQEHRDEKGPRYGVAQELARTDWKRARGGNLAPFELLDAAGADDEWQARALWAEYVSATRGRRAITWSRGLRDRLQMEAERTDDEVLEEAERAPLRFLIPGAAWDAIRSAPLVLTAVLEAVEAGRDADAMRLAGGTHTPARRPDPPPPRAVP